MNEEDALRIARENRERYLVIEVEEDLRDALRRQDYKLAKTSAETAYEILYSLYEGDNEKEQKEKDRRRLERLSSVIDQINEEINFGGEGR